MSISSSLQQIAGGLAAGIGGLIVLQPDKLQPIQNYNVLEYITSIITIASIFALYRVNLLISRNRKSNKSETDYPVMEII